MGNKCGVESEGGCVEINCLRIMKGVAVRNIMKNEEICVEQGAAVLSTS